jgi:arabinofuranosyltransferase
MSLAADEIHDPDDPLESSPMTNDVISAVQPAPRLRVLSSLFISIGLATAGGLVCWANYGSELLGGIDDAAIIHVYARNIANGFGFVFNVGGEHVEGATSLLWTLINAMAYVLLDHHFVAAMHVISYALTIATLFVWLLSVDVLADVLGIRIAYVRIVFCVIMLGMAPFYLWMIWSLMDVVAWAFIVALIFFLSLLMVFRDLGSRALFFGLPIALAASVITRPEGIAFGTGAIAIVWAFLQLSKRSATSAIALLVSTIGAVATTFIFLEIWRLSYFGFPLPNTYYAKVSSSLPSTITTGLKYVGDNMIGDNIFLLGILSILVLPLVVPPESHTELSSYRSRAAAAVRAAAFSLLVIGFIAVVVLTGGDHFSYYRFLVPIAPACAGAMALVGALAYEQTWLRTSRDLGLAGAALGAAAMLAIFVVKPIHQFRLETKLALLGLHAPTLYREFALRDSAYQLGQLLSRKLAQNEPPLSIGVLAAGGIALSYGGPIFDLLGLNWVEMAHANREKAGPRNHASFDPETFFHSLPDLVLLPYPANDYGDQVTKGILRTDRFTQIYEPVWLEAPDGTRVPIYARKDKMHLLGSDFKAIDSKAIM